MCASPIADDASELEVSWSSYVFAFAPPKGIRAAEGQ